MVARWSGRHARAGIVVAVSEVDVDVAGLHQLSGLCHQLAGGLPAAGPPPATTTAFQPSAAAVAAIHGHTQIVATRFAGRLQDTGNQLSATAAGLTSTDTDNAVRINAVGTG